jgi:hypothetical protein
MKTSGIQVWHMPLKVPFGKVVSDVVSVPSPYVTHFVLGAARDEAIARRPSREENIKFVMSDDLLREGGGFLFDPRGILYRLSEVRLVYVRHDGFEGSPAILVSTPIHSIRF